MDETTEPIFAVIGHPIAGNPTQFALETALASVGADCRVFSVDLEPDKIETAVLGMHAMNFKGVWVSPSCRAAVQELLAKQDAKQDTEATPSKLELTNPIDLLTQRPSDGDQEQQLLNEGWYGQQLQHEIWPHLVSNLLPGVEFTKVILVNEDADFSSPSGLDRNNLIKRYRTRLAGQAMASKNLVLDSIEFYQKLPTAGQVQGLQEGLSADDSILIVIERLNDDSLAKPIELSLSNRHTLVSLHESWDPQTLGAFESLKSSSEGCVIRSIDVHAHCLAEVVRQLFGKTVSIEVVQEAIDEYLAV